MYKYTWTPSDFYYILVLFQNYILYKHVEMQALPLIFSHAVLPLYAPIHPFTWTPWVEILAVVSSVWMFGPSSEQFELASVQVNGLALKTAAISKKNTNTNKKSLSLFRSLSPPSKLWSEHCHIFLFLSLPKKIGYMYMPTLGLTKFKVL